jgi:metal-responsive CopG/Arc/MetJ family transcriptional regulator
MVKKVSKSAARRNRTLKNMPDDLWREMNEHVRQTEGKQYAFIREAIREKLEREKEKS